jgi:hypothetical protein
MVTYASGGRDEQYLYRISFLNRCDSPRRFFWCAEHPSRQVPVAIACPSARGLGAEQRHEIQYRKEFQWHMPPGVRIRFRDCAAGEVPTPDFRCEPPGAATSRR